MPTSRLPAIACGRARTKPLAGLDAALARALAGGEKFSSCAVGEPLDAHAGEQLERGAQLLAGFAATALAP
jgi:hypothetical protein